MPIAFSNVLEDNASGTNLTSRTTTATITPATGELLLASVATYLGATGITTNPTLTGAGVTWVLVRRNGNNTARSLTVFRAMGAGSSGALTFTAGGSDNFNFVNISVTKVTGVLTTGSDGADALAQNVGGSASVPTAGDDATVAITPVSGSNSIVGFASAHGTSGALSPGTGYNLIDRNTISNIPTVQVERSASGATNVAFESASAVTAFTMVGVEVVPGPAGPTITTQPTAQVAFVSNGGEVSFECAATGTGTVDILAEVESGVGSGTYGTLADGSGVTWTGLTGTGSGSASTTLNGVATIKTLTGRRIRFKVDDDNGTTYSDAVALTLWTGPETTTFAPTDGDGESTATLTCDYVTGVGEAIEVRIPLPDGSVAVTCTTTAP